MEEFYTVLYEGSPRCGPGSTESTQKAYSFLKGLSKKPTILDVGCGFGRTSIDLAKISGGYIYANDINQTFLNELVKKAKRQGVINQIKIINMSMNELNFENDFFDVIWAESSIFIMGFEDGINNWKRFLKRKGYLVVSELIWFKDNPPKEVVDFFKIEYPKMKKSDENIQIIKKAGYDLIQTFNLSDKEWWDPLYTPIEKKMKALREKYQNNKSFLEFLDSCQKEINIFRKYSNYYGYSFYIMQKY